VQSSVAVPVRSMVCKVFVLDGVLRVERTDFMPEVLALPFLGSCVRPANRHNVARRAFAASFRSAFSPAKPPVPRLRALVHRRGLYVNEGFSLRGKRIWRTRFSQPWREHRPPSSLWRAVRHICCTWRVQIERLAPAWTVYGLNRHPPSAGLPAACALAVSKTAPRKVRSFYRG